MNWYRVVVESGKVISCELTVDGERRPGIHYIQAETQEAAWRCASNKYARAKVKETRDRYKSEGRCPCGRALSDDTIERTGKPFKKCRVCRERQEENRSRYLARQADPTVPHKDRLVSHASRQRDRRGEIRLETLLDVRAAWETSHNNGLFTKWLRTEIETTKAPVNDHT